jgi:conjugative relaxase-like TrwC/TraI family protein
MLRINQQRSAHGAKNYFNEGLAREDYYTKDEIIGRWGGKGADRLGLQGEVTKDAFHALCDNRNPISGDKLTCRNRENRSVAYDFTFNAPKSLSVLHALTGDQKLLDAFRNSVRDTMQEMEAEAKTRVRRGGANEERTTGNIVYGEFVHLTSRPVNGVPDPHLHSHCVVFNATYDQVEEKWKAAQFRDLVRDAPYYEAAFHSRLSRAVAELGYGVERSKHGWEIAGFSRPTLEKFSRRTAQIEEVAKEKGITSAEEKGRLGAKTREAKGEARSLNDLRTEWRGRFSADERQAFADVVGRRVRSKERPATAQDTVQHALKHGFERQSVVSEKRLIATALKRGYGSVGVDEVKRSFALESALIRRQKDQQNLVTTKEVLAEEAAVIGYARDGRGTCEPIAKGNVEIDGNRLNVQQQAAVRHVLTSSDQVMLIRGAAGAGKTSTMQAAADAIARCGKDVHVFAPTTEAARGVLRKEGFDWADTVARLVADPKMQQTTRGGVIWIDEAGLLGMRDLRQVFRIAKEQDARVVLMGDERQHSAVPRGDPFRLLQTHAGIKAAEVNDIRRQQGAYKLAVECLAKGDVSQGFERLDRMNAIQQVADDKRHLRLADDYLAAVKDGKSCLVVAPTHKEGRDVTGTIRGKLKQAVLLGREEREFTQQVSFSMTEAMRSDGVNYRSGDMVQFHQNACGGFRKGERWEVQGHDSLGRVLVAKSGRKATALPLAEAKHFDVYEKRKLTLAVGDRIRITQNGTTQEGQRLINGSLHTVTGFDRRGDILLDNNKTVAKDFGNLAHGYTVTSHASQGKTVDRVLIAMGETSMPATSKEQFYVSVSRGRESCTVYTADKRELLDVVRQDRQRLSATELTENQTPAMPKGRERLLRHGETQRRQEYAERRRIVAAERETDCKGRNLDERNRSRGLER